MPLFPKFPASLLNSLKAKYIHTIIMINSPNVQTHALDCAMNNYLYDMAVKPNIRVYCTCHDEQTDHSNYVIRL